MVAIRKVGIGGKTEFAAAAVVQEGKIVGERLAPIQSLIIPLISLEISLMFLLFISGRALQSYNDHPIGLLATLKTYH